MMMLRVADLKEEDVCRSAVAKVSGITAIHHT
jgi:hypothetical protein